MLRDSIRQLPFLACAVLAATLLPACRRTQTGSSDPTLYPTSADHGSEDGAGAGPRTARNGTGSADHYLDQAETALNAGDADAALQAFELAAAENPLLTRAFMGAGDIYREQGDYASAEKRYRRAVEIEPQNFDANYYHGLMLQLLNRVSEAVRAYRKALSIDPASPEANLNLATAYLQLGQPVEALPFARTAVRLKPDHGPTQANLGTILSTIGQDDEAVEHFKKALELMEPSPELILNLVESLRRTERYVEMVSSLDALIRMQPTPAAYERLGFGQFQLRKFDASEDAYRKALELDPEYFPAMNGLAVNLLNTYIRSARADRAAQDEALSLLRKSVQISPDQPKIIDLLSRYGR